MNSRTLPKAKGRRKTSESDEHTYVSSRTWAAAPLTSSSTARRYVTLLPMLNAPDKDWQAPKTCYNFLQLAKAGKYNDCLFHRLVPGFMVRILPPTVIEI